MAPTIPLVSLAAFNSPNSTESELQAAADKLVEACHRFGFVAIEDHGVPEDLLDEAFAYTKKLFDLPHEDKMKAPHPAGGQPHRGYSPPGLEKVYSKDELVSDEVKESAGKSLRKISDFKVCVPCLGP